MENVEEMVGTREAEVSAVATESGGAATTNDATAGDETAATVGVMYADEVPYTIDVRHVEEMVETTREATDGDRIRRGRDGDEIGGHRDEAATKRRRRLVTNETAATGGVMYTNEGS